MYVQIFLVFLFIALSSLFFAFFHETNRLNTPDPNKPGMKITNQCYFYTYNSKNNETYGAYTTNNSTKYLEMTEQNSCYNPNDTADPDVPCPGADVTKNFRMLFMFGGIIFLLDAFFRCFIVFGLFKRSIWF